MQLNLTGINRIYLIGDLHLGIKNNSIEWSEIQRKFLMETFPAQIENMFDPETDILFLEGDIFHSRDSINIRVFNEADSIFKFLTSKFKRGFYIIVGNHDVYYKTSNTINSLNLLCKAYTNLHVYIDPITIEINDKHRFLMLPWVENKVALNQILDFNRDDAHYIVCHADINGFSLNKHQKIDYGIEPDALNSFKRVYCGHIHIKQEKGNILYTGTPYSMDRGDRDTKKGFYVLDVNGEDVSETYIENLESPKFIKVNLQDILELSLTDIHTIFNNNYVDIMVETKVAALLDVSKFTELTTTFGSRKIEFFTYSDESTEHVTQQTGDIDELTVFDALKIYFDRKALDRQHVTQLNTKFTDLVKTIRDKSNA